MSPTTRTERDSLGEIEVPADRYWGAQTQRCLQHFAIGDERMPRPLICALGLIKQVSARVHVALGQLDPKLGGAIEQNASTWSSRYSAGSRPSGVSPASASRIDKVSAEWSLVCSAANLRRMATRMEWA